MIKNLVLFSDNSLFEHHIIYTINTENNKKFISPGIVNICSEQIFYYSSKWNFFYICKQLSKLLPNKKSIIIAHDWLELGMVSHLGLPNPVIQILHGDYEYYYNLAVRHNKWIEAFVTVAKTMSDKLQRLIPDRASDIHYLPFPVPNIATKKVVSVENNLQLIFVGRLTKDKGYHLLPLIEEGLRQIEVEVKWNIVGQRLAGDTVSWHPNTKIEFYGQLPNESVIDIMHKMDCLLLPSLAEGMPVTIVEAMKIGLTCIVNNVPGGVQELIEDGITGYKIKNNEVSSYVKILTHLNFDRSQLLNIAKNAYLKANTSFDPIKNTLSYELLFNKCVATQRRHKNRKKIYGSRLDQRWLPNCCTKFFRN